MLSLETKLWSPRSKGSPDDTLLTPFLKCGRCIVLDGGLATMLERLGHVLDSKLWSAALLADEEKAEDIVLVHKLFLESGADIIISSAYQASVAGFQRELNVDASRATEMMKTTVRLAVRARDSFWTNHANRTNRLGRPLIASSIGCYGAVLGGGQEYNGNYGDITYQQLYTFHRDRMEILLGVPGTDLFAMETIPSLMETKVLIAIMKEHYQTIPFYISWACNSSSTINSGELIKDCVTLVLEAKLNNLLAIGVNCTPPLPVGPIMTLMKSIIDTHFPSSISASTISSPRSTSSTSDSTIPPPSSIKAPLLLCYPNSGEIWQASTNTWLPPPPAIGNGNGHSSGSTRPNPMSRWCDMANEWKKSGASLIGGCCRTFTEHIAALRKNVCGPDDRPYEDNEDNSASSLSSPSSGTSSSSTSTS